MAQPDSVKLLLWFLALSSASLSWILPAVKVFLKDIQWDLLTTGLASILGLIRVQVPLALNGRTSDNSLNRSSIRELALYIILGFVFRSTLVFSLCTLFCYDANTARRSNRTSIRPASAWFTRFFLTVRWIFYIIMLVPISVGCYHNSENWPWLSTGATCVFAELLMMAYSVDNGETKDKSKKSTNYFEIIPFVLTLSVLLLFICIPRITMTPANSAAGPEWTFDAFYDQLESNELTDRQIYKNATRIRAGLIADSNRRKPDYSRAPLLFWFYDDIISIPPLTKLLRATYPKTVQATNKLYYSFFDDAMLNNDLFNFHGDQDPKYVTIMQRSIEIADLSNDTGSVEIYEKYVATVWNNEVAYQFALPENCVVTGVWLQEIKQGARPNKADGHKYLVSPRGAAQRVYNKLKERKVDPALLEQVGPMQYRLKVYPIPTHTTAMHMWLTYEFIKTETGDIPLPKLLRVDGADLQSLQETTIIFNNTKTKAASKNEVDSWMPEITVKMPLPTDAQSCTMMINQERVVVTKSNKKLFDPERTTVAVVVDASYSMRVYENAVLEAVSKLEKKFGAVDVFTARRRVTQCSAKECLSDPTSFTKVSLPLNKKDIIFLGSTNHDDLVISKAHLNATYDITILLTDEATINPYYKRSERQQSLSRGDFWMVHLNGKYPTKFQDFVTETMFINDAKVALSIDDVIDWYSPGRDSMHETDMKPCHEAMLKFAAKKYMQKYLREHMIHVDEDGEVINPLEKVHEMAIKNTIVTPYSSMIVLINRAQKDMLEIEEDKDDKFERRNEVDERYSSWQWNSLFSSAPSQFSSAVPALIFIVFLSLSYFYL